MKIQVRILYIIVTLLLGCFFFPLFGQSRNIEGLTIRQTVRWSGNINIRGDVIVAPSGVLIIEPGTRISFAANTDQSKSGEDKTRSEITVQGVLLAKGTSDQKITFTSSSAQPKMGDWYGIIIAGGRSGSEFDYIIVEYAYNGLTIKKSSPQISNSQIRYNFYSGLTIEIKSDPVLKGNIISENGYSGIVTRLGSNPILSDNIITLNQIGLIAFGNSSPNLGYLKQGADYNIGRNTIVDNQEYNIHNHSSREIKAENNTWGNTNSNDIGLTIYDANDEAKYGIVDIQPLFRSRKNLEQRFLGNQFSSTIAENSPPVNPNRLQGNQQSSQNPTQTNTIEQSIPNSIQQQSGSMPEPIAQNQNQNSFVSQTDSSSPNIIQEKQDEVQPLLVSNAGSTESIRDSESETEKKVVPQIDYEQIFLDVFLDDKKEILHRETPEVRNKELGLGAQGNVIVRVVVDKIGFVESASVLKSLNYYYDELSLESARKFRFKPGKINNKAVRFSTVLVFKF